MENHTLILNTSRITTEDLTLEMIKQLINTGEAMVEYFGTEIDHQADFVEDDMKEVSKEITFIEIFFETPEPIDYDALSKIEVDKLILNLLNNSTIYDMSNDGKDFLVNLDHHHSSYHL